GLVDRFVDGRLELALVDDQIGVLDGRDLLGLELDVVRLRARCGQVLDHDVPPADLLGDEGVRVERGDDVGPVVVTGASGTGGKRQREDGEDDGDTLHGNDSQA